MKAFLVGTFDGNKVYYDFDASPGSKDGLIVRDDGTVVKVYMFSWAAKVRGLKQIRNTPFHRFFWDAPKSVTKGKWFEMFIQKTRQVDKEVLDKLVIETTIGKTKKAIQKKNDKIIDFLNSKDSFGMVDYKSKQFKEIEENCCG